MDICCSSPKAGMSTGNHFPGSDSGSASLDVPVSGEAGGWQQWGAAQAEALWSWLSPSPPKIGITNSNAYKGQTLNERL